MKQMIRLTCAFLCVGLLMGNTFVNAADGQTEMNMTESSAYGEAAESMDDVDIVTEEEYVPIDPEVSKLMENVAMGSSLEDTPMLMASSPYWKEENGVKSFYDGEGNLVYSKGSKKVIDVSEHNGKINWQKVKDAGIDGAIIRLGWGYLGEDEYFEYNISECNRLGIPYGLYLYSYAYDKNFAYAEAEGTAEMLKGVDLNLSYPFYYDIENFKPWNDNGVTRKPPTTVKEYESIIATYIKTLSQLDSRLNGKIHVYSYRSYLNKELDSPNVILPYVSWAAEYGPTLQFTNQYYKGAQGWQYTSSGSVAGISGNVDMNCFSDQFYNNALSETLPSSILDKLTAQKLTFKDGYVSGFALGSDISTLSAALSSVGTVTCMNASENIIKSGKVATGQTISVTIQETKTFDTQADAEAMDVEQLAEETTTKTYTMQIMIRGDLNGDGSIGATDLYKLKMHIINKQKLNGVYLEAAKLANNSAGATSLLKIKNDIIGKEKITQ